jgi:DnaJ domain
MMLRIDALNFSRRQIESFALKILRSNEAISSPGHSSLSSCHPCRQFSSSYHHQQHHGNHNHHHRRRQQRSTPHNRLRISKNNPYDVLGIPRDSCADTVKRKFLQLALRHHPDTNRNDNQKSTTETFVKIREAFERIKQDFASREDVKSSSWLTEEEFDAWFHEETGQKMDAATRREVMHVYRYVC